MSYALTSKLLRAYDGPRTALPVLLVLADHADDSGVAWPSVQTIADRARISKRQARGHLSALAEAGWIRLVGSRKGGRAQVAKWRVVIKTASERRKPASAFPTPERRKPASQKGGSPPPPKQSENLSTERERRNATAKAHPKPRQTTAAEASLSDPVMVPMEWQAEAQRLRTDLTADQIQTSYTTFKDHHPGQQAIGRWRIWIRRENPARNNPGGSRHGGTRYAPGTMGAWLQGSDHETTDEAFPETIIESTARTVPD